MSAFVRHGLTAGAMLLVAGLVLGAVHTLGEAEELRVQAIQARPATAVYCQAVEDWRRAMGFRAEMRDLPVECRV